MPDKTPSWPRVVDEAYQGDPFVKIIECDGKLYRLDEAAVIEMFERNALDWRAVNWKTDAWAFAATSPSAKLRAYRPLT